MTKFSERLKELRQARGLKQREMAVICGERGNHTPSHSASAGSSQRVM